ncbi:SUF system FeS assembly protein, NifU family [Leptospira kirschneri serovar Mozdok]|nr:SUF system FeS assembly protein, NifU family [Leptospira kirschneri serovar Mozdok]NDK06937.1 hypothetical protein [Leptospira kirschneri serovar Mozdok]
MCRSSLEHVGAGFFAIGEMIVVVPTSVYSEILVCNSSHILETKVLHFMNCFMVPRQFKAQSLSFIKVYISLVKK